MANLVVNFNQVRKRPNLKGKKKRRPRAGDITTHESRDQHSFRESVQYIRSAAWQIENVFPFGVIEQLNRQFRVLYWKFRYKDNCKQYENGAR